MQVLRCRSPTYRRQKHVERTYRMTLIRTSSHPYTKISIPTHKTQTHDLFVLGRKSQQEHECTSLHLVAIYEQCLPTQSPLVLRNIESAICIDPSAWCRIRVEFKGSRLLRTLLFRKTRSKQIDTKQGTGRRPCCSTDFRCDSQ